MSDYDALLTSEGILHTTETPTHMAHRWDSGWVPIALAALYARTARTCPSGQPAVVALWYQGHGPGAHMHTRPENCAGADSEVR